MKRNNGHYDAPPQEKQGQSTTACGYCSYLFYCNSLNNNTQMQATNENDRSSNLPKQFSVTLAGDKKNIAIPWSD